MSRRSLVILVVTILSWPIGALLRRRYRVAKSDRFSDVRGSVLARVVAILLVALMVGWGLVIGQLVSNNVGFFTPAIDWRAQKSSWFETLEGSAAVRIVDQKRAQVGEARQWRQQRRQHRRPVAVAAVPKQ